MDFQNKMLKLKFGLIQSEVINSPLNSSIFTDVQEQRCSVKMRPTSHQSKAAIPGDLHFKHITLWKAAGKK